MQHLVYCKGLPGSGKSTWAREWVAQDPENRIRVNNDEIRHMFGDYMTNLRNPVVFKALDEIVRKALTYGYSVVVDNTHLSKYFSPDQFKLDFPRVNIQVKDFTQLPLATCMVRDLERENTVGYEVIARMAHNIGIAQAQFDIEPLLEEEKVIGHSVGIKGGDVRMATNADNSLDAFIEFCKSHWDDHPN